MKNLDDAKQMEKLDPSGVLMSTEKFADQCLQAWTESSKINFPDTYGKAKNIVVCGMGGSRFTPKTVKELFKDSIRVPYEINEDYQLPSYVSRESLVILSSYSGTTEEVISCGKQALAKGASVTAVAMGGQLKTMLDASQIPAYFFNPKHNPSGQPRIGGGYLLMGHIGLLNAMGYLHTTEEEVSQAISYARTVTKEYTVNIAEANNPSKKLARLLINRFPFLIASEFLRGYVNGFANQINETTKMISDYRYIPELNHHLMEGLKRPQCLHENGLFVFFTSNFYSERVQKRFAITMDVVKKQNVAIHEIRLNGTSKLSQVLEGFCLSGFTTFYMAMLYGTDPVAIPWVDYFKKELLKT